MFDISHTLVRAGEDLLTALSSRKKTLVIAESCTGGLLGGILTSISGSSEAFWGGFVSYSNHSKTVMLGLDPALLDQHGAVSAPVALAMVSGALGRSSADYGASITGIAGPGGGSVEKPVGLVYCAWGSPGNLVVREFHFKGNRQEVREQAINHVLEGLKKTIESEA